MTIRLTKRAFAALAFSGVIAAALPVLAAGVDYLIVIEGVPGENEVQSTFDPPIRAGACSGPIAGGSAMMNIKNPELVRMVSTGKVIPKATMTARKAGAAPTAYTYELKNIMISSMAGAPAGQVRMTYTGGTWRQDNCTPR
jgi:hypothetical protein